MWRQIGGVSALTLRVLSAPLHDGRFVLFFFQQVDVVRQRSIATHRTTYLLFSNCRNGTGLVETNHAWALNSSPWVEYKTMQEFYHESLNKYANENDDEEEEEESREFRSHWIIIKYIAWCWIWEWRKFDTHCRTLEKNRCWSVY